MQNDDSITAVAAMWRTILDDADKRAWLGVGVDDDTAPEDEIRRHMPWLIARLSPDARDLMRNHLAVYEELVAFLYRRERAVVSKLPLLLVAVVGVLGGLGS